MPPIYFLYSLAIIFSLLLFFSFRRKRILAKFSLDQSLKDLSSATDSLQKARDFLSRPILSELLFDYERLKKENVKLETKINQHEDEIKNLKIELKTFQMQKDLALGKQETSSSLVAEVDENIDYKSALAEADEVIATLEKEILRLRSLTGIKTGVPYEESRY